MEDKTRDKIKQARELLFAAEREMARKALLPETAVILTSLECGQVLAAISVLDGMGLE